MPDLILTTHIQSLGNLLLVLVIQVSEQDILVLVLALVLGHIIAPTPDGRRQASRHIGLLRNLSDGVEVSADGKDDAA